MKGLNWDGSQMCLAPQRLLFPPHHNHGRRAQRPFSLPQVEDAEDSEQVLGQEEAFGAELKPLSRAAWSQRRVRTAWPEKPSTQASRWSQASMSTDAAHGDWPTAWVKGIRAQSDSLRAGGSWKGWGSTGLENQVQGRRKSASLNRERKCPRCIRNVIASVSEPRDRRALDLFDLTSESKHQMCSSRGSSPAEAWTPYRRRPPWTGQLWSAPSQETLTSGRGKGELGSSLTTALLGAVPHEKGLRGTPVGQVEKPNRAILFCPLLPASMKAQKPISVCK